MCVSTASNQHCPPVRAQLKSGVPLYPTPHRQSRRTELRLPHFHSEDVLCSIQYSNGASTPHHPLLLLLLTAPPPPPPAPAAALPRGVRLRLLLPAHGRRGDAHLVARAVPSAARAQGGGDHARVRRARGGAVHDERAEGVFPSPCSPPPACNGVHLIPIHPLVHSIPNPRWQTASTRSPSIPC